MRRLTAAVLTSLALWSAVSLRGAAVYAQRLDPVLLEQFLADPLADQPRDPALPQPAVERPLSPLELYTLEQTLDALNQQAQALLAAGEVGPAFELWRREVRLRRVLGSAAELIAIERVAPLAWNNQRSVDVRLLTQRLREIWAETAAQPEPDEARLERLLTLFTVLRDEEGVIGVTQQLADRAAARGDGTTQRQRLAALGDAYLAWFEFDKAAAVFERLVADVAGQNRPAQEQVLLQQLIYSYQQNSRYAEAIPYQQRLLGLYRGSNLAESEVPLEIAIARNYRALENYPQAVEYYQLAYRTAQQLEQYGYSSEVLQDLGELYRSLDQFDDAITMYNLLVRIEQQSYNHYGILYAYDQLGQIYQTLGDRENALVAFRSGLAFAESLDYRQDYFQTQIEKTESGEIEDAETESGDSTGASEAEDQAGETNPAVDP
ncbi:MAG: tetratricopeptide repeat protein [Cyanobacteria bacterium P01_D01_bin.14]